MLLASLLSHLIRFGQLEMVDADGRLHRFGTESEPAARIRLHDRALHWKLALRPRLAIGEAYMDGSLTVEKGTIYDVLSVLMGSVSRTPRSGIFSPAIHGLDQILRRLQQYNPRRQAEKNVAHHYDLSAALYDLFLDKDRQYSCAYFTSPSDDLETAQAAKKRHIAAKLLLKAGQKVLDIGSGWGGLALYLAQETGAHVTGLTLSQEQLKIANERAAAEGLGDQVHFHLRDYRNELQSYDRIVSVGMFEHVGVVHYDEFFAKIAQLLKEDGVALLHAIGRADGPGNTNPWLRKYIFPGGYSPALSEVIPSIERAQLWITDIEILRLHYADTLAHWRRRFVSHWEHVKSLYDERFCRMWEFYLAACEAGFRVQELMVFQIQLSKKVDAVPRTRDYIYDWERSHRLPLRTPTLAGVAE